MGKERRGEQRKRGQEKERKNRRNDAGGMKVGLQQLKERRIKNGSRKICH